MKLYKVNKKVGETPLEALERLRKQKKISAQAKLTYIGRLDPMAEGLLIILKDATQSDREKYLGLDKTYEAKILLGFTTDTWDLLGVPQNKDHVTRNRRHTKTEIEHITYSKEQIEKAIKKYNSSFKLPVPAYSSVQYKGKSLFEWARAGKVSEKQLPLREMKVTGVKLKELEKISSKKLLKYIQTNIKKVKGDFRQGEILKAWSRVIRLSFPSLEGRGKGRVLDPRLASGMTKKYQLINITISVSSGTYIRSIAHDLGKKLGTGGVLYSLKRTRVGNYK